MQRQQRVGAELDHGEGLGALGDEPFEGEEGPHGVQGQEGGDVEAVPPTEQAAAAGGDGGGGARGGAIDAASAL